MNEQTEEKLSSESDNTENHILPHILRESIYLEFLSALDTDRYLDSNPDLAVALEYDQIESLDAHFRHAGLQELYNGTRALHTGINPYNETLYLQENSDVNECIGQDKELISGFEHYLLNGYREILDHTRNDIGVGGSHGSIIIENILRDDIYQSFLSELDTEKYLAANEDLATAIEKGTLDSVDTHFRHGGLQELYEGKRILMEGLMPYDEENYLSLNDDIAHRLSEKEYISGFEHFLLYGYKEIMEGTRTMSVPSAVTDMLPEEFYRELLQINKMIIEKKGFFDHKFYLASYPDVRESTEDPLIHYLTFGAQEQRDPNAHFSTSYYVTHYPDVLSSGLNPLVHYILVGEAEKRQTRGYPAGTAGVEFHSLPLVSSPDQNISLKIAVVIHAFYIDVLEDIIASLDYIAPKPDLFISVSEDADIQEIEVLLRDRGYTQFTIKAVQNRGRDVAPFLVEFSEALKSYDVCCKIHGKKSLYAGSEQSNWRNHLYHNLLGSEEIVNDILNAFSKNEKLGLLFSDNYGMIPYWGYTWLTNKNVVHQLLQRLHLQQLLPILDRTYIDYPAGTMFWFRPEAISQILDSGLKYEDFPEEPIANDGTIAHGLERLFAYVTRLNGYDYIEQNRKLMQYTKNITHKNFYQHEAKTLETAKNIAKDHTCVIFDIFDTLVTRTIFYPDNLFRIIEEKFDKAFSIRSDFMKVRKETEYRLRTSDTHTGDISYDDIYDHIHLYGDYTPEMVEYLRTVDFGYELEVLIPKPDTIALLQYVYDNDIEILFVSDMYLTKEQVMLILQKQNIPFKEENIFVSSDTGLRKDNTTIWKYLVDSERIDPSKTLMIGDSEVSDAKLPGDFRIGTFHLLSEKNAFFESPFGKAFMQKFGQVSEEEMLLMGPVANRIFSSAFELSDTVLDFSKKCDPYTFGYTALAPFFYLFMNNIYKKFADKRIFFLARDGYFMQKVFEHFMKTKELEPEGKADYLQISRRAVLGAVIKNEENLKNMILDLGDYKGMFSNMIYSRVGLDESFIEKSGIEDFPIDDPQGLEKAYALLVEHIDLINHYATKENQTYLAYLESIGFFEEKEDVLIDLGYSGTIQNYLYQLTSEKLTGLYFVTTEKVNKIENENNILHGYFADRIDPKDIDNIIYKYALILEAFLTSDKGQLICFTEEEGKIKPKYKEETVSLEVQNKMVEGIMDYLSALSIVSPDFIDTESMRMKDISLFTYEYMIKNRLLDDEILGILHLEDEFTGNKALDIMTILTERGI